jgi:hypothetical protein
MSRRRPILHSHLLTRSDLAQLRVPASDVLAWLAAGAIDQVGDLPGDDPLGSHGRDPVFTVPSEPLRRDLAARLATIGKSAVVLTPLRVRSFLMRALMDRPAVATGTADAIDLAVMLGEAANGVTAADVEATLRLAQEEARMEATEQGEPTEREPETETNDSSKPPLAADEQLLFGDGDEEPVCFGFDDLARALGESPLDEDAASETPSAVEPPVDEVVVEPVTDHIEEPVDEPVLELVEKPVAATDEGVVAAVAPPPLSAACELEARSFIADIVREVESKRQLGGAAPEVEPAPTEMEPPAVPADDVDLVAVDEASKATDEPEAVLVPEPAFALEVVLEPAELAEPAPEAEPAVEIDSAADAESDALAEATPETEVEPAPLEAEQLAIATSDLQVEADVDVAPEATNEPEVEPIADPVAEPVADPEPRFEPVALPEPESTATSESESAAEPDPVSVAVAEMEPDTEADAEVAPEAESAEPPHPVAAAMAGDSAELIAKSMASVESFLGQLQGALVELAQRPAATVDVAPLVQAVHAGFEQSTQLAMSTSTALSSLGAHVDQLGARVEQGVGRVVQSLLEQPAVGARQQPVAEFVVTRASRMPFLLLAFATLVIAWSILFWIKTGSPRLALGTLIGGNLIGCCLLGYGRAR